MQLSCSILSGQTLSVWWSLSRASPQDAGNNLGETQCLDGEAKVVGLLQKHKISYYRQASTVSKRMVFVCILYLGRTLYNFFTSRNEHNAQRAKTEKKKKGKTERNNEGRVLVCYTILPQKSVVLVFVNMHKVYLI